MLNRRGRRSLKLSGVVVTVSNFALPRAIGHVDCAYQTNDVTVEISLAKIVIGVSGAQHSRAIGRIFKNTIRQSPLSIAGIIDGSASPLILRVIKSCSCN